MSLIEGRGRANLDEWRLHAGCEEILPQDHSLLGREEIKPLCLGSCRAEMRSFSSSTNLQKNIK
jgi:hypothetical protein